MGENMESLALEHLRHIRSQVDGLRDDVKDIKHRMATLEQGMMRVKREVHLGDETDARQQLVLDKIIERIERRLDLESQS